MPSRTNYPIKPTVHPHCAGALQTKYQPDPCYFLKMLLKLVIMVGIFCTSGCDVPSPAQYDVSMLRVYLGASTARINEDFGNAPLVTAVGQTTGQGSIDPADRVTMRWEYTTPDGPLLFHINREKKVVGITYLGQEISSTR